jgi:hypothetical protein
MSLSVAKATSAFQVDAYFSYGAGRKPDCCELPTPQLILPLLTRLAPCQHVLDCWCWTCFVFSL